MELILLRHGIAEKDAATDSDRALTAEGAKKIARVSRGLRAMLKKNEEISICSSPSLRTMQTAQIVANRLKVKEIKKVQGLATGEEISSLLSGWIAGNLCDVLIFVGHQPFLTEWSAELTGNPLPFKKGAAAGYAIEKTVPLKADLRWFIQPGAWPPATKK